MKILLTTLNAKYVHTSLALRNIDAYCRQRGMSTSIREYTINQGLSQILSDIYGQKPEVIGIACYIWNIRMVTDLCSLLRKVLPNTTLILGGPEVSYDPTAVLQSCPAVDYVILGEGEESFYELAESLSQNDGANGAPTGVVSRVCGQSKCRMVECLDTIPFAYKTADLTDIKERIIYYESSRGCPFSCQYCLSSATAGVRYYSLARVISDLQVLIDHDVRQVKFVDRTFNTRKEHYLPIIAFLAKQNCRTNFHFEIAADLLDEETILLLASAPVGRFQLEIGVQSTHEPTLRAIQRKNNWDKIVSNVTRLREGGNIHLHLDLIVGLPFEPWGVFACSFNSVYSLQPHMLQIGFLKMLKGSGVREAAEAHEYVYSDEAPYEVLANRYMSYGEIRQLHFLEDVFNLTYNTGRYAATLNYYVTALFKGNAFAFYQALGEIWEQNTLYMLSHNPKAIFAFLAAYCQQEFPAQAEIVLELLKYDALNSENGSMKPDFLPWNYTQFEAELGAFWRDVERVRRYIPDYRFTSWRETKTSYQIEIFRIDIPLYLASGVIERQETVLLFDYRARKVFPCSLPELIGEER